MFEISIKDIIDIFLVALMLFYIYRLMKESRSLNVFIGIIVFVVRCASSVPLWTSLSPWVCWRLLSFFRRTYAASSIRLEHISVSRP